MTGTPLHSVHVDGGHRPRSAGDGVVRDGKGRRTQIYEHVHVYIYRKRKRANIINRLIWVQQFRVRIVVSHTAAVVSRSVRVV